jgi:hypothetical protein
MKKQVTLPMKATIGALGGLLLFCLGIIGDPGGIPDSFAMTAAEKMLTVMKPGTGSPAGDTAPAGSIVWWKADSTTLDTYNATDGSAVTVTGSYVAGHDGNGLLATTIGQGAVFTATAGHSLNMSNGWADFWYKNTVDPGGNSVVMFSHTYAGDYRLDFTFVGGDYAAARLLYYGAAFYFSNTIDVFDGAWHHIRVNWVANGTATLTIDGTPFVASITESAPPVPSGYLVIGTRFNATLTSYGIIDSFALGE